MPHSLRTEKWRGIGEPKRHYQKFKMPMVGSESRLLNVIGIHSDLVVARMEISEIVNPK